MKDLRGIGLRRQLAVICSLLIVFEPLSGATAGPSAADGRDSSSSNSLIAVAKVTGSAERNGQPLLNGSVVSTGDALSTHDKSALLLTATPQERIWLGPNSSAKVSKDVDTVLVTLIQGTVSFRTQGHLQVSFESHDGLALRSHSEGPRLDRSASAPTKRRRSEFWKEHWSSFEVITRCSCDPKISLRRPTPEPRANRRRLRRKPDRSSELW